MNREEIVKRISVTSLMVYNLAYVLSTNFNLSGKIVNLFFKIF